MTAEDMKKNVTEETVETSEEKPKPDLLLYYYLLKINNITYQVHH